MQAVWLLLMDDEFMHAYLHGIELEFFEDDSYIFFPRILTDSNDYPEKYVFNSLAISCVSLIFDP
jgi:hypothetical protein